MPVPELLPVPVLELVPVLLQPEPVLPVSVPVRMPEEPVLPELLHHYDPEICMLLIFYFNFVFLSIDRSNIFHNSLRPFE